jgi:hypothetical protein
MLARCRIFQPRENSFVVARGMIVNVILVGLGAVWSGSV